MSDEVGWIPSASFCCVGGSENCAALRGPPRLPPRVLLPEAVPEGALGDSFGGSSSGGIDGASAGSDALDADLVLLVGGLQRISRRCNQIQEDSHVVF